MDHGPTISVIPPFYIFKIFHRKQCALQDSLSGSTIPAYRLKHCIVSRTYNITFQINRYSINL